MNRDFLINSAFQCCTQNYFDEGRRYYFFINEGKLYYQKEGAQVKQFKEPFLGCKIVKVAADNNRVFVLTESTEGKKYLYWCCIKEDISVWVQYIFMLADVITSPDDSIDANDEDLADLDKLIKYLFKQGHLFKNFLKNSFDFICSLMKLPIDPAIKTKLIENIAAIEKEDTYSKKKQTLKKFLNGVFTELLKHTYKGEILFQDTKPEPNTFAQWATLYRNWVSTSHQSFRWNQIRRDSILVDNVNLFRDGPSDTQADHPPFLLNPDNIIDIAVGNWYQTVTTYYLQVSIDKDKFQDIFHIDNNELSKIDKPSVLLYLDEEPIMHNWKIVPGKLNSPYPLTNKTRINAAQSVISAVKKKNGEDNIYWIRYDYHNFKDFAWFPLNWTESYFGEKFDVDTLRLYMDKLGLVEGIKYFIDKFLPKIQAFFKSQNTEKFIDDIIGIYKETETHHPGWHVVENPVKGSDELHLKVTGEYPWAVPFINSTMLYLLKLSKIYQVESKEAEKLPIDEEILKKIQDMDLIDTIAEILLSIYSSARGKMKKESKINDVIQNLGFLGENPIIPSYNYPVQFKIKEKEDTYKIATIPSAIDSRLFNWQEILTTKKCTIKACNGKYLSVLKKKENKIYSDKREAGASETFTVMQFEYNVIALKADNNAYLGIKREDDNNYIAASFEEPGTWESFKILPIEVAFRAGNGKYIRISREPRNNDKVIADAEEIDKKSTFRFHHSKDDTVTIMSVWTGRFLIPPNAKEGPVYTTNDTSLKLTEFRLIRLGIDDWALKTKTGQYVSVKSDADNSIVTVNKEIGKNEIFKIVPLKVALQANNKEYLRKVFLINNQIITDEVVNDRYSLFQIIPV